MPNDPNNSRSCEQWMNDMATSEVTYCRQCGSEDLAYVEQYADSKEYRCNECGERVTANVEVSGCLPKDK